MADATTATRPLDLDGTPHCQQCGSTDWEDLNEGDQGYTACCNEIVMVECAGDSFCSHGCEYPKDGRGMYTAADCISHDPAFHAPKRVWSWR